MPLAVIPCRKAAVEIGEDGALGGDQGLRQVGVGRVEVEVGEDAAEVANLRGPLGVEGGVVLGLGEGGGLFGGWRRLGCGGWRSGGLGRRAFGWLVVGKETDGAMLGPDGAAGCPGVFLQLAAQALHAEQAGVVALRLAHVAGSLGVALHGVGRG